MADKTATWKVRPVRFRQGDRTRDRNTVWAMWYVGKGTTSRTDKDARKWLARVRAELVDSGVDGVYWELWRIDLRQLREQGNHGEWIHKTVGDVFRILASYGVRSVYHGSGGRVMHNAGSGPDKKSVPYRVEQYKAAVRERVLSDVMTAVKRDGLGWDTLGKADMAEYCRTVHRCELPRTWIKCAAWWEKQLAAYNRLEVRIERWVQGMLDRYAGCEYASHCYYHARVLQDRLAVWIEHSKLTYGHSGNYGGHRPIA